MIALETKISEAEELFMHFKLGQAGSGYTALINCIFALDTPNRKKMALGFPEIVDVVNRYNNECGYWSDLVTRYNEEYQTDVNP
jgi:ABC-type lipoprotein export system ATPase subunit